MIVGGGELSMDKEKDKQMFGRLFQIASVASVFFSAVGAFGYDLYLASTQWLLVSIVLACWGIYLLLEAKLSS
jgi:hypothetical protein